MRNTIQYYYNLSIDNYTEYSTYSILLCSNDIYIFKSVTDISNILEISTILTNNKIKTHTILINNNNEIITEYKGLKYVLMKVNYNGICNPFYIEVSPKDINIIKEWANQIDYSTKQIMELVHNDKILIESFNYFVGLAENAITLYNDAIKLNEPIKYSISHKRIYSMYGINYLDPTSMLIDVRVRDITEYIKSNILDLPPIKEVVDYINKMDLSNSEINILYARLLYPSYYFDLFYDLVINQKEKKLLVEYINNTNTYEEYLYSLYKKLKEQYNIYEIEWLKK